MKGQRSCYRHGGARGPSRAAGARRLARQAAEQAVQLADIEVEPITNPIEALAEMTAKVIAWTNVTFDKVNELQGAWRYESEGRTEQLRAEVSLLNSNLETARKYLEAWAKLGLEGMRVEIQAHQIALVVERLDRVADRLELSPEQREAWPVVVREELMRGTASNGEQATAALSAASAVSREDSASKS